MSECCVITDPNLTCGVYLHRDGDIQNVIAALRVCELAEYKSPSDDPEMGFARLAQVMCNVNTDGYGVGVLGKIKDHGDNGIYIVKDWRIVGWYQSCDHGVHDSRDKNLLNLDNIYDLVCEFVDLQNIDIDVDFNWYDDEDDEKFDNYKDYINDILKMKITKIHYTKKGEWRKDKMYPPIRFAENKKGETKNG